MTEGHAKAAAGPSRRLIAYWVIGAYALLTVIATWPLALQFDSHSPGSMWWGDRRVYCDTPTFLWNLWWFRHSLLDGRDPFDCEVMFYPHGASLWYHPLAPLHGLLGVGLQWFLSLTASRNAILFLDFAVSGCATFLLARRLDLTRGASFLAGAAYAYSPIVMAHLYTGHYELVSTCWIPATLCLFLGLVRDPKASAAQAVWLGLALSAAAYTSHYLAMFSVELLCVAACALHRDVLRVSRLKLLAIAGLIFALAMAPIVWQFASLDRASTIASRSRDFDLYSADLASFVTPSFMHPLFSNQPHAIHQRLNPTEHHLVHENTTYLGFVLLALAAWGYLRAARDWWPRRLLAAAFVVGLALSLGAHLKVFGVETALPMPAWLLPRLPFVRFAHAPGRHALIAMLALSLIAAHGWQSIARARVRGTAVALLALEFLAIPLPLFPTQVTAVATRLRDEPGEFAILELPLQLGDANVLFGRLDPHQLLDQTVHARATVGGSVARLPRRTWIRILATPVVGTLAAGSAAHAQRLELDRIKGPDYFSRLNIQLVVVRSPARGGPDHQYVEQVFRVQRRELLVDGTELLWLDLTKE